MIVIDNYGVNDDNYDGNYDGNENNDNIDYHRCCAANAPLCATRRVRM